MSISTIGLNDNLRNYLLDVSCRESKTLKDLRQETSYLKESQMQISPEQGSFLSVMVNIINAKKTLDDAVYGISIINNLRCRRTTLCIYRW